MKKYILIFITSLIISITLISLTIIDKKKLIETPLDEEYMAYFVDGEETDTIPEKGNYYVSTVCDKGANAIWNYDNWGITIYNATQTGTRCSVTFTTRYQDSTGATAPELYAGLIPITYDESNNILVADVSSEWYNYTNHEWANAILIDQSNSTSKAKYLNEDGSYKSGTTVDIADVLQMYVWVPRYKYKLFNVEGAEMSAQMIEIEFEDNEIDRSTGSSNGDWLTHPAFTFGTTELNGIWVGKFESSGSLSDITIKPNLSSLRSQTVGNMFNASRAVETTLKYGLASSEIDTHMMKNVEWGAVAYLTNSKYGRYNVEGSCVSSGCKVWINNNNSFTTGCAGSSISASSSSSCNQWNTAIGVNASTTGNIYGIYDMNGGSNEYVMGFVTSGYDMSSFLNPAPPSIYYDVYDIYEAVNSSNFSRWYGHAVWETRNWHNDSYTITIGADGTYYLRGNFFDENQISGLFYFSNTGVENGDDYSTFRVILSKG